MTKARAVLGGAIGLALLFSIYTFVMLGSAGSACAIGLIAPLPHPGVHAKTVKNAGKESQRRSRSTLRSVRLLKNKAKQPGRRASGKKAATPKPVPVPQSLVDKMAARTIAPGVVHKYYRGALTINVIDVDMVHAPVKVRPVLAGEAFNRVADVEDHARQARALAAVNANYFKRGGTPLGTLIVDGEWVAGPLFERISLGISGSGYVRVDRVNLHGILETSNPHSPTIWVNNINQPRRTGSRLIVYTRRWGSRVVLPYAGCLVAVNAQGEVIDVKTTIMEIPWGGYVLSDRRGSPISRLRRGDVVNLTWQPSPATWRDVVHAVSGGPVLIKNGKLFVDTRGERFRPSWTSRQIKARTAAGVTWNNHLLLVTVEGPHTLFDLAKFLHALGAEEALNLDGGGSTTMVVKGQTVTRNADTYQRRVPISLAVLDASYPVARRPEYRPRTDLSEFAASYQMPAVSDELANLAQLETSGLAPAAVPSPSIPLAVMAVKASSPDRP